MGEVGGWSVSGRGGLGGCVGPELTATYVPSVGAGSDRAIDSMDRSRSIDRSRAGEGRLGLWASRWVGVGGGRRRWREACLDRGQRVRPPARPPARSKNHLLDSMRLSSSARGSCVAVRARAHSSCCREATQSQSIELKWTSEWAVTSIEVVCCKSTHKNKKKGTRGSKQKTQAIERAVETIAGWVGASGRLGRQMKILGSSKA